MKIQSRIVACVECGKPFEAHGHRAKWCSEHCRKQKYRAPCIECGALTWHGTYPGKYGRSGRCVRCSNARQGKIARERRKALDAEIIRRRELGYLNWAIEEDLGLRHNSVASRLCQLRKLGVDVPPSPYYSRASNGN